MERNGKVLQLRVSDEFKELLKHVTTLEHTTISELIKVACKSYIEDEYGLKFSAWRKDGMLSSRERVLALERSEQMSALAKKKRRYEGLKDDE